MVLYHYPCIKFLTVSILDHGLATSVAASSLLSICADLIPLVVLLKLNWIKVSQAHIVDVTPLTQNSSKLPLCHINGVINGVKSLYW